MRRRRSAAASLRRGCRWTSCWSRGRSACGTPAAATFLSAEDVDRAGVVLTASERDQVESFLHGGRVKVVALLDGLTEEQARRRVAPSLTTLLGLVKQAAFVERVWLNVAVAGRSRAEVGLPDTADESFELGADDTGQSVTHLYRDAWSAAVHVCADYALDDLALHTRRGPVSLRWI